MEPPVIDRPQPVDVPGCHTIMTCINSCPKAAEPSAGNRETCEDGGGRRPGTIWNETRE